MIVAASMEVNDGWPIGNVHSLTVAVLSSDQGKTGNICLIVVAAAAMLRTIIVTMIIGVVGAQLAQLTMTMHASSHSLTHSPIHRSIEVFHQHILSQ